MATRDLTRTYLDCRSRKRAWAQLQHWDQTHEALQNGHSDLKDFKSEQGLLEDASAGAAPCRYRDTLAPDWVSAIDELERNVGRLEAQMKDLSTLHAKRLMVTFDETDELAQDQEIESAAQSITTLFRQCEATLKRHGAESERSDISAPERAIRLNAQRTMAVQLRDHSMAFRDVQKEYMERLRIQKSAGVQGDRTFDFLAANVAKVERDERRQLDALQNGEQRLTSQQLAMIDSSEELVTERDEDIQRIAQSIEELSEIFKELAVLVIDQGTILDRIDFNMEQVTDRTTEGVAQLRKAEQHQKDARPLKCVLILVFLIFAALAILIYREARH